MGDPGELTKALCATPLGLLEVSAKGRAIVRARFVKRARVSGALNPALKKFLGEIRRYFQRKQKTFSASFYMEGTPFQKKVWKELSRIPFGRTVSYKDIARRIGSPKAVRAVGGAAARNPIVIAVPCHRVIARDEKLSGYAFGPRRKAWLLSHERR